MKKSFSGYSMVSVERWDRGAKPRMSPHRLITSPSCDILVTTPYIIISVLITPSLKGHFHKLEVILDIGKIKRIWR
jgi:hypothetical protein